MENYSRQAELPKAIATFLVAILTLNNFNLQEIHKKALILEQPTHHHQSTSLWTISKENWETSFDCSLQSWAKYLTQILDFMWNKALREIFSLYFSVKFSKYWQYLYFRKKKYLCFRKKAEHFHEVLRVSW